MSLKRSLGYLLVLTLATGILWAQDAPKVAHTTRSATITPAALPAGSKIIYTNLGPTHTNLYNAASGYYLLGPSNSLGLGEQWIAVPFTPTSSASATLLAAAIGLESGTSLIDLSLYSDNAGTVGTLIAGGSSTQIPTFGVCCSLVQVKIPSTALTKGTQYWVVATTDDTNAPTFTGVFESTNQFIAYDPGQAGWFNFGANVPGVAVLGN